MEERLERLRKLWSFAISLGNERWAAQISLDANKIKNEAKVPDSDLYGQAEIIFGD